MEALELGIKTLMRVKGDILIASDPDADRLGVAVMHKGEVHHLNGNQIACLCLNHICNALTTQNTWPVRTAFIKTIATTELFQAIAESYQRPCFNVLTGFKYIAELIHQWEQDPEGYQFIFGGEESYGYLLGTQARDKDAILSGALVCEMALQAKVQGKTLIDELHAIYQKYGVYIDKLFSIQFEESKVGKQQMLQGIEKLRKNPPETISGVSVVTFEDYKKSIHKDLKSGLEKLLDMQKSDMLVFWLADGSKLVVRPSGTEPKVKIYCGVMNKNLKDIPQAIVECESRAKSFLNDLKTLLS